MSIYRPIWQERAVDGPFEFWGLRDEGGTLTVALQGESSRLHVSFDSYLMYRKYDEGDALRTPDLVSATGGLGRSFYMVEQSEMLDWVQPREPRDPSGQAAQALRPPVQQ